tara:strand:- start:3177 stop:3692 length:516 start_codon:yes stop_codon:yes gene_type:complete
MKNINNDLEKIKDKSKISDIYFLSNKEIQTKFGLNNRLPIENINKDFIKYKKDIKNTINELYTSYLDNSNNNLINNINNQNEKYIQYFNLFVVNLIQYIKSEKIKNTVQTELDIFSNNSYNNSNSDSSYNSDLINLDKIMFNNPKPKNPTIDELVTVKNVKMQKKILPKKR